jgi:hypothetical protein
VPELFDLQIAREGTSSWSFGATFISFYASNTASFLQAWVAKLADATDSLSIAFGFPRLMDYATAGVYTGTSYWTVRQAVQRGLIPVVEWRGEDGEPIRRVLLDRNDLDEFVDGLTRSRRPD